ncbi:hypothetical protein PLICRDRAFT_369177 [Plicaturopsis crispa FD-325 SS-3]|uniref:Unplaced genomic scaffold PLICRscaffold_19, whole genome shotgun sequence n=1 Tax=Plicaturopsis crispa FD-325 SS-3 TaxID=944288 RepID=A0A0C9SX16_PLICR|nr:hypothetical protein PLICRDRAFT_369177 [Plicaturopsis crispa FD-325 SS-3]
MGHLWRILVRQLGQCTHRATYRSIDSSCATLICDAISALRLLCSSKGLSIALGTGMVRRDVMLEDDGVVSHNNGVASQNVTSGHPTAFGCWSTSVLIVDCGGPKRRAVASRSTCTCTHRRHYTTNDDDTNASVQSRRTRSGNPSYPLVFLDSSRTAFVLLPLSLRYPSSVYSCFIHRCTGHRVPILTSGSLLPKLEQMESNQCGLCLRRHCIRRVPSVFYVVPSFVQVQVAQ